MFLSTILFVLIIGPTNLKINANNFLLILRPINFTIKKEKYMKIASKKYFIFLIINNLKLSLVIYLFQLFLVQFLSVLFD